MKKFFKAFLALVLAVLVSSAGLFGCKLVVNDNDKDMARVVATIDIGIGKKDKVYKKDLVISYMNYGYVYEQYYGWTKEKTVNFIVDSLIETRVLVQSAIKEFDEKNLFINETPVKGSTTAPTKWETARYLDEEERIDAEYGAYQSMNALLDNYAEVDEGKKDTSTVTERAVPTNAQKEELSKGEKEAYIAKGFDVNGERNSAFKQVRKVLEANGLLGEGYNGTLESTDFFKNSIKSNQENIILEKFEKYVQGLARNTFEFSNLETAYKEDLDTAKEYSEVDFAAAMSSATADKPLLYGAYGNYGYVYNLLLGVNEYQQAQINALDKTLSSADRMSARKTILAETTATDLRDSWVYGGFDSTLDAQGQLTFKGDYTFNSNYSLPFQGKVKLVEEKPNGEKIYGIENKKTFNMPEFVSFVEKYVYGQENGMANAGWAGKAEYADSIYKVVNSDAVIDGYADKINELLFAFSTDGGSLNTYKGYAVSPAPNGTSTETYMAEFAEASRQLFAEGMGKSSYVIVATDYGYHFVFFSKVFSVTNAGYEDLTAYLNAEYGTKDWGTVYTDMLANWDDYEDTDNYLYLLTNRITQNAVTKAIEDKRTEIINENIYGSNTKVVKHKDVYADLLK